MQSWNGRLISAGVASLVIAGCQPTGGGGGGGGGNGDGTMMRVDLPIGGMVDPIELEAGVMAEFTSTFDVPLMGMQVERATVDMAATIMAVQVTPRGGDTARAFQEGETVQVIYRIGPADQVATVCETGFPYGPFTVTMDANAQPTNVDPPEAELDNNTISVINDGVMAICVQGVPTADSTVCMDTLSVDVELGMPGGDCGDPSDMAGTWMGTYTCFNDCGPDDVNQDITLIIAQDGTQATYTDDEAFFEGTICGNVFTFSGGLVGAYTESGQFTLNADGSGSKTSMYQATFNPACGGNCEDTLQRAD